MIKTEELRLGNWLLNPNNKTYQKVAIEDISDIQNGTKARHGIPLTEDVLLKCGFEYKDGEYIRGLWKLAPDYPKEEVVGYGLFIKLLDWTRVNQNSIKHLHQLQNLYYALTGQELEIKL